MKILIIDKMHESIESMLKEIGHEPVYDPSITREEILQRINDFEGIIVRSKTPIDSDFLSKAQHLKFVARAGAGIDNVDMTAMENYGIQLLNAPEGNRDAVAEHTLGLILALFNNLHVGDQQIRKGIWDREGNRGEELGTKTVGILGYGFMGQAVAKRLQSFGCKVIAYDQAEIHQTSDQAQVALVDLETFKEATEVLTIHIPLNKENFQLIDQQYLLAFKNLKYIVNTARGEVLKLEDALSLLEAGKLKGLALDVLPNEKLNSLSTEEESLYSKLYSFNSVILSPHVAGWTHDSYEKINKVLVNKIKNLLN